MVGEDLFGVGQCFLVALFAVDEDRDFPGERFLEEPGAGILLVPGNEGFDLGGDPGT